MFTWDFTPLFLSSLNLNLKFYYVIYIHPWCNNTEIHALLKVGPELFEHFAIGREGVDLGYFSSSKLNGISDSYF